MTVPRMLRVYFRYDRSLQGRMSQAAYGTVCDVYGREPDAGNGEPATLKPGMPSESPGYCSIQQSP